MAFSSELLDIIHKRARNKTVSNAVMGGLFALGGVGAIVGGLMSEGGSNDGFLLGLGGGLVLFGGLGALWYVQRHIDLASILKTEPTRVVWVYLKHSTASVSAVRIARFNFVVFGLSNKRRVEIRMNAEHTQRTLQEARAVLPHAAHGYSRNLEQVFRKDPSALGQNAHNA